MNVVVQTRPSNAWRWTKCSAAPLFAALAGPQEASEAAMEGTCAAWLADEMLQHGIVFARDYVGEQCPENDWPVDLEMAGHIQAYVDMIRAEGGQSSTERHVELSPLVRGTLDNCATYINGVVRVRDLKYGYKLVEPDAEQLVIYGGALCLELLETGHPVKKIVTEIYQPRGFHSDGIHRRLDWTLEQISLRCNEIILKAEECHKPNPLATPGKWCLECDGAVGCEALQNTATNLVAHVQSVRHHDAKPEQLASQLGALREAKEIIDAASKAVETEALTRHKMGEPIPGYGRKERFGHRKFHKSREAIKAMTGIDPVVEKDMSPAQLIGAGASKRAVDMVSHKPSIGFKLEKLDPRDLINQFPQNKG